MEDITKRKAFGKVIAFVYTIEFQKRGLPHAHILLILENKLDTPIKIDKFVSAEIPDIQSNRKLHNLVKTHMIHGPCGPRHQSAPCMSEGRCTKEFPKTYSERTIISEGYPRYKRTRGLQYLDRGRTITNADVVPYNAYLLQRYNCHINVEVCTSIQAVKYLFKYSGVRKFPHFGVEIIKNVENFEQGEFAVKC